MLVGCGDEQADGNQTASMADLCQDKLSLSECVKHTSALEKQKVQDDALFANIETGSADPIIEANRATQRRDFRLFGYSKLVPGIHPATQGIECRVDLEIVDRSYFRGMYAGTDVLPASEKEAQSTSKVAKRYNAFSNVYNKTVVQDPSYPWGDICRPVSESSKHLVTGALPLENFGYRDLEETAAPTSLGEAARRGTLDSLIIFAKVERATLNHADFFGLTPLAWAVVYRRRKHALSLLQLGANPEATDATSPLQIARAMRWREMIEHMKPFMRKGARSIYDPPILVRKSNGTSPSQPFKVLVERYQGRLSKPTKVKIIIDVSASGKATNCKLIPTTGIAALDRDVCSIAIENTNWTPARGEFGEPVSGRAVVRMVLDLTQSR